MYNEGRTEDEELDFKVTKKCYPRINNGNVLEFILERDPNLFLRKNKIQIHGRFELDSGFVVENGFASKLFSMLTVELNSQVITKNLNRYLFYHSSTMSITYFRGEFFLCDYITKIANFDGSMIDTGFYTEGYIDNYNCNAADFAAEGGSAVVLNRQWGRHTTENMITYEFIIIPSHGFLASPDLLIKNCEIKLSFDRAPSDVAILNNKAVTTQVGKTIEIKDCYAMVDYVSSPDMRTLYDHVDQAPFIYKYDDLDIIVKNIPENQLDVRFDNLRGGQIPDYLFIGLIPKSSLGGDKQLSSTGFRHSNVTEMNISFNGNSVNGYPMNISKKSVIYPLQKFLDVTGSLYNQTCSKTLTGPEFEYNFLWSHKFEAEMTDEGWIGINLTFDEIPTEQMVLVVFSVYESAFSIDKYRHVEKINI